MIFFEESAFIPASGSTCSSIHLSESASIDWMRFTCYIPPEIPQEEDDAICQLRQRKLRYVPFHIQNKPPYKSRPLPKPFPAMQIMKEPFKIGQR